MEFAERVFANSKNPKNLWKQKKSGTGKYKFTDSDKKLINDELLKIVAELIEFAEKNI